MRQYINETLPYVHTPTEELSMDESPLEPSAGGYENVLVLNDGLTTLYSLVRRHQSTGRPNETTLFMHRCVNFETGLIRELCWVYRLAKVCQARMSLKANA